MSIEAREHHAITPNIATAHGGCGTTVKVARA